ncbi:MAG: flagellar hook protein FlgE [Bdellovibrio sp.]|nr:flagellar hook protein FlgE [Bdellovibrio sp.]
MGVLSSLWTGVSGLQAHGEALSVVADNVANASTTGFKASRAEFQDIMSKNLKGIDGGNQMGRGVRIGAVNPVLAQGNIDQTERGTDLAINGDGYFQVKGGAGVSYTRDGSFHFDRQGFLVSNNGQKVQGYQANDKGQIESKVGDIQFPRALVNASGTKEIKLDLNLDSRTVGGAKTFDMKDPYKTSDFATAVETYDSQGNKHTVNLFFNKGQDRTWSYKGLVDGKEVEGSAGQDGMMSQVCEGKVQFTEDGKLQSQELTSSQFNFKGGAKQDQQIKISFGEDIATGGKGTGTKQFGKESDVITWRQDGYSAGNVLGLSFNDEGVLTASYSNGQVLDLGQVLLAKFENPEALFKQGGNLFKQSRDSGEPSLGAARMSGRGSISAKSLERSTVDIASEFVTMITDQRAFQANAKTITTADELLNEVIQLKR